MSKAKYLYIDDENDSSVKSIINGFNDAGIIQVERLQCEEFGKLRNEIIKLKKGNNFDGLIIDLRLDGEGPDRVDYNATAISQELRSICARGDINSFPIVLCSTEPKIRDTYMADKSSHDLFDYKFEKSITPDSKRFSKKLSSLSNGYNWLNKNSFKIEEIFSGIEISKLDSRIIEKFETKLVTYDYVSFVIKDLFHNTGPLIKEKTLAARLGIDIEKSDDWQKLKDLFGSVKFGGLFHDGWDRWWAIGVEDYFFAITNLKLANISADKRVEALIQYTKLKKLVAATPLPYCKSNDFWTICEGHKKPLDPLEGFKIFTKSELRPWHESKYISFDAIVNRIGRDKGLRESSSEKERVEYLKALYDGNGKGSK